MVDGGQVSAQQAGLTPRKRRLVAHEQPGR
jgi:hypothetical protein